jgi:protein-disulfide isomerase
MRLSRRSLFPLILGAGSSVALPSFAEELPEVKDMSLGNADAPVTVIEYASLTCPHCASWHKQTWPKFNSSFVDSGKVNFIFREVYFDRYGLWAAMVARCAGETRYFGLIDVLFENQAEWSRAGDDRAVVAEIFKIGRQAGMTDEEMDACIRNEAMAKAMVAAYQTNAGADGIDSTPSFVVNGKKVNYRTFDDFDRELAKLID